MKCWIASSRLRAACPKDREVDILTRIEPTGEKIYERAVGREALRLCLEGAAEHYTRSYRSSAAPTQAMLAKRYSSAEGAALKLLAALKGQAWLSLQG